MAKNSKNITELLKTLVYSDDILDKINRLDKYSKGNTNDKEIEKLAQPLKEYISVLNDIKKGVTLAVKDSKNSIENSEQVEEVVSSLLSQYLMEFGDDIEDELKQFNQNKERSGDLRFITNIIKDAFSNIKDRGNKTIETIESIQKKYALNKQMEKPIKYVKSSMVHKTTPSKAAKRVNPSTNPNSLDKKTIDAAFKKIQDNARKAGGVIARGSGRDSNKYYFVPTAELNQRKVINKNDQFRIQKAFAKDLIEIDYFPVRGGTFVEHGNKKAANYSAYIDNSGQIKLMPLPQEYLSDIADASEQLFKEFGKDPGLAKWKAGELKKGIMDKAAVMNTNKYNLDKDEYGTSSQIQTFFKANNINLHTFIKNLFQRSEKLVKKSYGNNGRNRETLEMQIMRAIYIKALDVSNDIKQELFKTSDMAELIHSGAFEEIEPLLDQLVTNFDLSFDANSEEALSRKVIGLIDNSQVFFGGELSAMLRKVIQTAKTAKKVNTPKKGIVNELMGHSEKIEQTGPEHQRYPIMETDDRLLQQAWRTAYLKMEKAEKAAKPKLEKLYEKLTKTNSKKDRQLIKDEIKRLENIRSNFYKEFGYSAASVDDDQSLIVSEEVADELVSYINKTVEVSNDEIDARIKQKEQIYKLYKNSVGELEKQYQELLDKMAKEADDDKRLEIGKAVEAKEREIDSRQNFINKWENENINQKREDAIKDILEKEYSHLFDKKTSKNLKTSRDNQTGLTSVKFDYVSFMDENTKIAIGARRTQAVNITRAYARQIIRTMFGIPDNIPDSEIDKYSILGFVGGSSIGYNDLAMALNEKLPILIEQYKQAFVYPSQALGEDTTKWREGFIQYLRDNGANELADLLVVRKNRGFSLSGEAKNANVNKIKSAFGNIFDLLDFNDSSDLHGYSKKINERLRYTTMNVLETLPINPKKNAKMNDQARRAVLDVAGAIGMSDYGNKLFRAYSPSEEAQEEYETAKEAITIAALLSGQSGTDNDIIKDNSVSIGFGVGYDIDIQKALNDVTGVEGLWDADGRIRNVDLVAKTIWGQIQTAKEDKLKEIKKNNPKSKITIHDIGAYFDLSNTPMVKADSKGNEYKVNRLYIPNIPIKQNRDGTYTLPQNSGDLTALMSAIAAFNDPNNSQGRAAAKQAISRHAEKFLIGQENARDRGYYYEMGHKNEVVGSQQFHGRGVNVSSILHDPDDVYKDINIAGFQTNRNTFLRNLRNKTKKLGNNAAKIEHYKNLLNELTFGKDTLINEDLEGTKGVQQLENRIADYITLRSKYFNQLQEWIEEEARVRATNKNGKFDASKFEKLKKQMRFRGIAADMLRWPLTNRMDVRGMQWFINQDANLNDTEFTGIFGQRIASNMDFDSDTISAFLNPLIFSDAAESRAYTDKQKEIYLRAAPRLAMDREKKMGELGLDENAFATREKADLQEVTDLFAKHFKGKVGMTSNLSTAISNMIDSVGLSNISVGNSYDEQLQAAKSMITRNMMEGIEQNMISAKHAIKLLVKNGTLTEKDGEKEIAKMFGGASKAFDILAKTGDLTKLFEEMSDLGIFGSDEVLDSRISAVTMSAIQGFSHGEKILKELLGADYQKIVHGNAEDYGRFSKDVVANAVQSTQNQMISRGVDPRTYNWRKWSSTGHGGEANTSNYWDRFTSQYGKMIGENSETVNTLTEATERLESAIYKEAEAEKYKINIAKQEGKVYDENIGKLKDLTDTTKQLDKANRIAESQAKGENVYNPSVTTMLYNAFGGSEFPDLTGFRNSRNQFTGRHVGKQLAGLYGEEAYQKYIKSEQDVIFGNIAHGVKAAIGEAQNIGYTGDTYRGMVTWLKKQKDINDDAKALWDKFLESENEETHEHGIFDLIKQANADIKKQSLDKESYLAAKEAIITNATYAGESLGRGSQVRAAQNTKGGFVQSEVNLGGVIEHAQHGRADTIVGSYGGKRWDSDLHKFVDDENMATIEVQDIKTRGDTNLTAKNAMQPILYAYYLKLARDYIKEHKYTENDFVKFNGAQNPLKDVGMDIDEQLFKQLAQEQVGITAAVQTYNQKTGQFVTRRADIEQLLRSGDFVRVLKQVIDSGKFSSSPIDKDDYHFITDRFVESTVAGETGIDPHAQRKIENRKREEEDKQREQDKETAKKNYVELLEQELRLEKGIAEFKQKHGDNPAKGSSENTLLNYKNALLAELSAKRELAGNAYEKLGGSNKNDLLLTKNAELDLYKESLRGKGGSGGPQKQSLVDALGYNKQNLTRMITQYFSLWRVLGKVRQEIQKVIQITKQLDQAATNIRIVTGMNRQEVDNAILSYNRLAEGLGTTTTALAQSANAWLRQGYSISESMDLITATTQLSKLGMLDMNSATKVLTSTLKGFKMQASEASTIVDKLTKLDMNYAASAGEIGEAMARTSAIASQMGLSLDETAAMVTTIMDVTQQSAEMAGTAVRSILSRYGNVKAGSFVSMMTEGEDLEKINDIEKVLGVLGISIRNSKMEMRDMGEVLDELAKKWNTLSSVEQSAVATAFAGTRQRNFFTVMLSNWDRVREAQEISANSAGTAAEKYEAQMESIEASINKVQNAWEGFTQRLGSNKALKGFFNVVAGIVKHLDKIIISLTSMLTAMNAYKIGFGSFMNPINKLTNSLNTKHMQFAGSAMQESGKKSIISTGFTKVNANIERLIAVANKIAGIESGGKITTPGFFNLGNRRAQNRANRTQIKSIKEYNNVLSEYDKTIYGAPETQVEREANQKVITRLTNQNRFNRRWGMGLGYATENNDGSLLYAARSHGQWIDSEGNVINGDKQISALNAQRKAVIKNQRKTGAITGAVAGIQAGMSGTNSYFGGLMGSKDIKINDIQSDTADNIINGVATGAATGLLSAIPGVGPLLGPILGPIIGDGIGGLFKWLRHRDEIDRKQRVEDAKKDLEALNKIESATKGVESAVYDLSSASAVNEARKAVEDLIYEISNSEKPATEILEKLEDLDWFNLDNWQQDLYGILLSDNSDRKQAIIDGINGALAEDRGNALYRSQEEDRYSAKEKYDKAIKDIEDNDDYSDFEREKRKKEAYDVYKNTLSSLDRKLWSTELESAFYKSGLSSWNLNEIRGDNLENVVQIFANSLELTGQQVRTYGGELTSAARQQIEAFLRANDRFNIITQTSTKALNQLKKNAAERNNIETKLNASYEKLREVADRAGGNEESFNELKKWADSLGWSTEELRKKIYEIDNGELSRLAVALNTTEENLLGFSKELGMISLSDALKTPEELRAYAEDLGSIFSQLASKGRLFGETLDKVNNSYFFLYNKYDEEGKLLSIGQENILDNLYQMLFVPDSTIKALYKSSMFNQYADNAIFFENFKNHNETVMNELKKVGQEDAKTLREVLPQLSSNEIFTNALAQQLSAISNEGLLMNELRDSLISWQAHDNEVEINNLQEIIKSLKEVNEERENELELIKAKDALENAKNEKKRVYRAGIGWTYESDTKAIQEAQENLENLERDQNAENLQYQIDLLEQQNDILNNITKNEALEALKKNFDTYSEFMEKTFGKNFSNGLVQIIGLLAEGDKWKISWNDYTEELEKAQKQRRKKATDDLQIYIGRMDEAQRQIKDESSKTNDGNIGKIKAQQDLYSRYKEFLGAKQKLREEGFTDKEIEDILGTEGLNFSVENYDKKALSGNTDNQIFAGEGLLNATGKAIGERVSGAWYGEGSSQGIKIAEKGSGPHGRPNENLLYASAGNLFTVSNLVGNSAELSEIIKEWSQDWDDDNFLAYLNDEGKWILVKKGNGQVLMPGTTDQYEYYKTPTSVDDLIKQYQLENKLLALGGGGTTGTGDNDLAYAVKDGNGWRMVTQIGKRNALGTYNFSGGPSFINELGTEGIVTPQGTITALPSHTGIVPADLTRNLFQLGEVAPNLIKGLSSIKTEANRFNSTEDNSMHVNDLNITVNADSNFNFNKLLSEARQYMAITRHNNK